jgi:hypothetical protein
MKAMATLDTITYFLCYSFPAGWAEKLQSLTTSSTEYRALMILKLAYWTDHANNSLP